MWDILDSVADATTSLIGTTVEVASLGLIDSKDAKSLADAGYSIYKISQTLGISESQVKELLS